jgi:alkyl hydroperoxide reductase subunit AhpF
MWIVAKDVFGGQVLGRIAVDGFGIVIQSTEGHDMRRRPIEHIAQYTLLDPPG